MEDRNGCQNLNALYEERKGWIDEIQNLTPTFLVHSLQPLSWYWGFSDLHMSHDEEKIKAVPDDVMTSMQAVHTVFEAHDEGTFEEALKEVLKKTESMNYKIISEPYGTLLIKTHEEHVYHRYFEIWIPVRNR